MSVEQNAIQKLYSDPKAKGFVNHLIGAYLPIHKPTKVWSFKHGQKHKCNICGTKVFDIETAFNNMKRNDEKIQAEFGEVLKKQVEGEQVKIEEHPMYKYVTQGALPAWTGEDSNTVLCMNCITDLLDMVQSGILTGDKNLTWLVNKMQRTESKDAGDLDTIFHKRTDPVERELVKEIDKGVQKTQDKVVTTFGDIPALQALKQKMEQNGKD